MSWKKIWKFDIQPFATSCWKHPCDLSRGRAFLWTVPSQHVYLLNLFSYAIVNMIHKASLALPLHASSWAHRHDPADQLLQLPLKTASNQCLKPDRKTASTRATSPAAIAKSSRKYFQGELSPHLFLYAHCVEDHPLHLLPFYVIPLSSIEHHTS